MKIGFAFFLYFFFQLIGGFTSVNAADCAVFATSFQQGHKANQVQTVNANHDQLSAKTDGTGEECVELPYAEDNEEEEFIKKQTNLIKCLFALSYTILFNQYNSDCAKPLSAPDQLTFTDSDKYIAFRVLRI